MHLTTAQRLAAAIAGAVLLVSALALVTQYVLVKRDLMARQTTLVQADLAGFAALYDQRRIIAVRQAIEFRLAQDSTADMAIALWDRRSEPLAGNIQNWPPRGMVVPAEGATTPVQFVTLGDQPYLGTARMLAGGFALMVARSTASMNAVLAQMRRLIAAALAAIAVIGALTGHFASRWILRKITRINALADQVAGGDLSARLPGPADPDEFGTLQRHFHHMLDRVEALNRATHHLSDTVAHELRTPLTRIQARLSRLNAGNDSAALQEEIRSTVRIFDSLLEIARAEAEEGQGTALPLNLSDLLVEICELYEPLADTLDIAFRTDIAPAVTILGDRNLIAQLISNLLDNALKFSPPGQSVTVSLAADDPRHLMRVSDTGRGLPPGFEAHLFDRFARADPTGAAPGHGLGLALVKAVALRHGAKLSLPATDKGFAIEIAWPKVVET